MTVRQSAQVAPAAPKIERIIGEKRWHIHLLFIILYQEKLKILY